MCLILFAWQAHPRYPLIAAANRDEFHERPTAAAEFWRDASQLLAGRDLQAGGTWLGVTRGGRFAAITNYREPRPTDHAAAQSRGALVRDFLIRQDSPGQYAADLRPAADQYQGFSLLLGIPGELVCISNRSDAATSVPAGVHGLSNHLLDTPWPKVRAGRERLSALVAADQIDPEALLDLLKDRATAPGDFPEELHGQLVSEQLANHYFIVSPTYGTRSSTVVLMSNEGTVNFTERQYGPNGRSIDTRHYEFELEAG